MITAILLASALLTAGEPVTPKTLAVVDGDTLKVDGVNVRISNLDTPETGPRAECLAERLLGSIAAAKADELIKGNVVIWPEGKADKYKRPLVRVTVDGRDWEELMGLALVAVPWEGKQADWCGPFKND